MPGEPKAELGPGGEFSDTCSAADAMGRADLARQERRFRGRNSPFGHPAGNACFSRFRLPGFRRALGAWAAVFGLAALVTAPVPVAAVQIARLVSNTGQGSGGANPAYFDTDHNQNFYFYYGSNSSGYMLTSVDIELEVGNPEGSPEPTYSVSIERLRWERSEPIGLRLGTLKNPSKLKTGLNRFTAPGTGIRLPRGWTFQGYGVTIDVSDVGGRDIQIARTWSDGEDSGSAAGLTVGNYSATRSINVKENGGWWKWGGSSLKIAVNGYPYTHGMPGKVPAPAVSAGTAASSLSVSWNSYQTDTDYDLRYYAGDADPADPADWVEEGEPGGHTHTGTATTATITGLAQGTAYRVQVRAANGVGPGPWSDSGSATTGSSNTAPRLLQLSGSDGCEEKTSGTAFATLNLATNALISTTPLAGRDRCSGSDRMAPMFEDPDGDALTYSTSYTLPAKVHFFDGFPRIAAPGSPEGGSQGRLYFRGVTAHEAADIRVDVTATDPHGASASTHVVLKGKPPANTAAPRFAATASRRNMAVGAPARWVLPAASGGDTTYTDARGDTITVPYVYAVSELPAGLVFDAATRTVRGTPTTLGTYRFTYTADDADGAYSLKSSPSAADTADAASQTATITVAEVIGFEATGAPTISGLARAGETLRASSDDIADADGLTGAAFAFQWVSRANGTDTDIAGATSSSYVPGPSDVGAAVKVRASFTDDAGFAESLTSDATAQVAPAPLTASFHGLPAAHDGSGLFSFEIRFSREFQGLRLTAFEAGALSVTGGRLVDVRRAVAGQNRRLTVRVRPASSGDVTVALAATTDCSAAGAICMDGGRTLESAVSATVAGPAALTASFHGLPDAHDGERRFEFEVRFSEEVAGLRLTAVQAALTVTGGRLVDVKRTVRGENRRVTVQVRPAGAGAVTVALAATTDCSAAGAICASGGKKLAALSATVPGPNAPATGAPTIAGTAQVGGTLTASTAGIADADGLANAIFAFQWVSVRDGADTDIAGATSSSYTLADADADASIRVRVSFTDDAGNAETLTSAATAPVALPPLTASFHGMAAGHDGSRRFAFEIRFSEEVAGLRLTAVQAALSVTNGKVVAVKRAVAGQIRRVTVQVRPDGVDDVTITLPATADCSASGAICTPDGRRLSSALTATVRGPVALSVADAGASEADEAIAFTVTLSRAASGTVTVDYATRDGTATAGEDYTFTRGTLTFAAGELGKTVSVPLLDDAIDEGEETFTLKLTNPLGAAIGDGEATGTIENSDPLQRMWLSRFGRTVAGHVVDAVSDRLAKPLSGAQVTAGGQSLNPAQTRDGAALSAFVRGFGAPDGSVPGDESGLGSPGSGPGQAWAGPGLRGSPTLDSAPARGISHRELLLGSAFHLARENDGTGPGLAAWGRVTTGGFDGEAPADSGTVRIDGDVTTGVLGADAEWERLLAGVAVSMSEGEGSFEQPGVDTGTIESTMTTVSPYARVGVTDRVSVWGLAGWGTGDMTIVQAANDRGHPERTTRAGLAMRLAALGGRGALIEADESGGIDLALRADAFWMETESEPVSNEGSTAAKATRVRLALEGSRSLVMGGGGVFTPGIELGLRHDGGDAETGTGVELGGRVSWMDPETGLGVEARTRALIAHENSDYGDWGASGAVRLAPGASGRGLSFRLAPTWGAPSSGVERLWSARDARGLSSSETFEPERRLDGEFGYGLPAFGGAFTGTPNVGFGFSDTVRDWRIGWRLTPAARGSAGFEVKLGATRKEPANHHGPVEHGVALRGAIRW